MFSPKTKRNILRIIPFGLIWFFFGLVFLTIEFAAVGEMSNLPDTAIQLDFGIFIFAMLAVTGVGLLIGTIELVYLDQLFAKESFTKKILYKLLIYALVLFVVISITFPIAASLESGERIFSEVVWDKYFNYLASITFLSTALQMAVSLGASLFYAEISENIGHGVLMNFFTGKYHSPVEEERVFMFLDMKSSTTIAEQLGHIAYFKLLQAYYFDLSDAVVEYAGQIYKYVGDEIIISWKYNAGTDNNNCIKCFFAMQEDLRKREDWYIGKFGLLPTFKAGIHCGKVTTGEIGVIKKEIFFTGDVLNATARIQGLCNTLKVDLLVSDDLMQHLDLGGEWKIRSMGTSELRGRTEKMKIYTILPQS